MHFYILTLFPELFDSVFGQSIVKRALEKDLVSIDIYNIRDYAMDKHKVTDEPPYGGGGGMVMKVEPIVCAVEDVLCRIAAKEDIDVDQVPVILLTPVGRTFTQGIAREYERCEHVVLICGRYEGVDERVRELVVTDEISIGDYVLSGGEIPAMAFVEAVTRLVPGVLGDMRATIKDSYASGLLEHPHYTRPAEYRGMSVPDVLLSGDHAKIAGWRRKEALRRTWERRPDLLEKADLTAADRRFLTSLHEGATRGDEDGAD
ncbi:MAG: tRNA (guanosine(37)-N1)-methyltransferase TrmD [Chloroflexota bacterium]|nr:tRNA (guanosine(37)-N1)-methyltransferase TrmD [Chloroflexota bacterium]